MVTNFFKRTPSKLDEPIDAVLDAMALLGPDTDEYDTLLEKLERLEKLKRGDRISAPSGDMLVAATGNILGILAIIAYEQKHVMVSKALGMVTRPKTNP